MKSKTRASCLLTMLEESKAKKKLYLGNCVSMLDDPKFQEATGIHDATMLAQVLEKARPISKEQFMQKVDFPQDLVLKTAKHEFQYFSFKNILFAYDQDEDVHYVFG